MSWIPSIRLTYEGTCQSNYLHPQKYYIHFSSFVSGTPQKKKKKKPYTLEEC